MIFMTSAAKHLKLKGRKGRYSVDTYPSGEMRINILDNVKGKKIYVIGSVLPDANSILELMILADGLKVKGAKVEIILPYLTYLRQDKPHKGEPFAARVICRILNTADVERVYVLDAHTTKLNRYFKFHNAIPLSIFANELSGIKDAVVIAPDKGGKSRARAFAKMIGCKVAYIEKKRLAPGKAKILHFKGDVREKNAIIMDDMIDTGGTVIKSADILLKKGAKEIYVAATHGLFSGNALQRLEKSKIKKIIITNTVPVKLKSRKLKIIKIEPLVENLIKCRKK